MAEGSSKAVASRSAGAARAAPRALSKTPSPAPGFDASAPAVSVGSTPQALLALQATAGNRAVCGLLGPGRALDDGVRREMETRFDVRFANVRVHDDRPAQCSAALLEAKAYTHGEHIVFGADRFAPHSAEGRRLLAHELAHVVQQRRGGAAPALDAGAPHERAAHRAADALHARTGPIPVEGASGIGIARDEDDSFLGRMKRKAQALKEAVPPEYREKAQVVADFAADKTVDAVLLPVGGPLLVDGLGSKLLHGAQGDPNAGEELKGFARDKALEHVGAIKGVASQVTEVADTAMWYGNEYANLRDKAAEAVGGKPGSIGNNVVRGVIDSGVSMFPGTAALPSLAQASAGAKSVGLVDESGNASLTAPMSNKLNEGGDWLEKKIGGSSSEPGVFTPMEKGELEGALLTQVALALTGVEEVKVATAALGLMGSFRGIVESIRADPNGFYKHPAFWSSILTAAMSIAGLSKLRAGKKIVDVALKSGALLSALPPLWQLYDDYNDPKLQAGDPDERHKVLAKDWNAVIRAVVDALIVIAHSAAQGKAPKKLAHAPEQRGGVGDDGRKPPVSGGSGESGQTAATTDKPPSAKQVKRASEQADTAEDLARRRQDAADAKQQRAKDAAAKARQVLENAQAKQQEAKARADAHEQQRANAEAKQNAPQKERDKAAAELARARKAMDAAQGKAQTAQDRAAGADKKAQESKRIADEARRRADAAQAKAQTARAKADAMKFKPDPQTAFDPSDPAFAAAPDATLKPNREPIVWVRTGKGDARGTYVFEGDARGRFGQGDGVTMPKSQAEAHGLRPAGQQDGVPIEPRRIGGRKVESNYADAGKGRGFVSATAREPGAVKVTSIPADTAEAHAYNEHLRQGEIGLQRPLGSNARGVDSITAQVEYDGSGRPVRAKIFLNDATTPTAAKYGKPSHETWLGELEKALNPPTDEAAGPPGAATGQAKPRQPLFDDPALEKVIRDAAADGRVYVRIVRVETLPSGQARVTIKPSETWPLGAVRLPAALRQPLPARRDGDGDDAKHDDAAGSTP